MHVHDIICVLERDFRCYVVLFNNIRMKWFCLFKFHLSKVNCFYIDTVLALKVKVFVHKIF